MRLSITPALALAAALLLSLSVGLGSRAGAQPAPPTPPPISVKGGNATLAVTNASANVALPSSTLTFPVVQLINDGNTEIFYNFGTTSGAAATTSNAPLPAGASVALFAGTNGWVAAITASSTSTLRVVQWNGAPVYARSGGSAGGGFTIGSPVTGGSSGCNLFVTSTSTVGCVAALTESDSGSTLTTTGNLLLPDTSGAGAAGVILYGGARFIHNQNANSNVFIGHNAYNFTGTATQNVCVGESCMLSGVSGVGNTCVGRFCMGGAVTGNSNTALGSATMGGCTSCSSTVSIGNGANGVVSAANTTVVGSGAAAAATGAATSVFGFQAGIGVTGSSNTLLGANSAPNLAAGSGNTFLGSATGGGITTGSDNLILGRSVVGLASGLTGAIVLASGNGVVNADFGINNAGWSFNSTISATLGAATGTNAVCNTPGTKSLLTVQVWATGCAASAMRFKREITGIDPDRAFETVMGLRPVSYYYTKEYDAKDTDKHVGFIAEQAAGLQSPVEDYELVTHEKDSEQLHGFKYNEMAPLLTAAFQKSIARFEQRFAELKADNDNLRADTDNLRAEIETLKRASAR